MTDSIYSPEFVKGLFNRMSSSYERMNYVTSFGFSIRWRRQFLDSLQTYSGKIEIIDLMTGMGETWNSVRRKFPNANLSALDFSTEMLKSAKLKNDRQFGGNVTFLQQDILEGGLPTNYYDIVICAFGLKTFDNEQLKALAAETQRILKTGGQVSFIEVSRPKPILLRKLYGFYLGKLIPVLGRLLLSNPAEYKMLWHYTERFDNANEAAKVFKSVGFTIKSNSYFYGCATGFSGYKR